VISTINLRKRLAYKGKSCFADRPADISLNTQEQAERIDTYDRLLGRRKLPNTHDLEWNTHRKWCPSTKTNPKGEPSVQYSTYIVEEGLPVDTVHSQAQNNIEEWGNKERGKAPMRQ
jgi:hypothetical protein